MKVPKKLAWRVIDGEAFIVDAANHTLHNLNQTGSRIWQMLEKGKNLAEIADAMIEEFEVSKKDAEKDAKEFLKALEQKKLIEIV
ncbi:MAG: PqqD family protein [Elusimicrobia bacterium]|nr:PqqD family protein [Elusimicrobiota bacterium]